MVDASLFPAIRQAIKANELGPASPYQLSYARLGQSGGSFGIFQGDAHVNPTARNVLTQILQGAGADPATVSRIVGLVSQACPNGNPLTQADTTLANNALSSPAGVKLVDQMDSQLLNVVLGRLDTSIAAATAQNMTIDPAALLYLALWVNMTGAPNTFNQWIGGTAVAGVAPPTPPAVTVANVTAYLLASSFFVQHPGNFAHFQQSAQSGVPLLPAV